VLVGVLGGGLRRRDLVVLGGMTAAGSSCLSRAGVAGLQAKGILAIAHLPLISSGLSRPAAVRQWLAAARTATDNGFDGLYLDELVPERKDRPTFSGLEQVVRSIRNCCPDGLLLAQQSPMRLDPALVDGEGHDRPLRGTL